MERLRELRKKKKLTQHQIASDFGVARPTYTKWESGEREPDHSTIVRLADYFNVSLDYLFGRYPPSYNYELGTSFDADTLEVANAYAALPNDSEKNMIRGALKLQELKPGHPSINNDMKRA